MTVGLELSNAGRVVLWRTVDKSLMTVGSNPECDLCVPADEIAPIHFLLRLDGARLSLVNRHGEPIVVGEHRVEDEGSLHDGDCINLGPVTATVRWLGHGTAAGSTRTLQSSHVDASQACVLTAPTVHPGRSWSVGEGGVTVGADPTNDVVLDDPYVSAFHARFFLQDGRCIVRDLGSRNGLFVGERKLSEGEVTPGTQVRLGKTPLMVVPGEGVGEPRVAEPTTRLVGSSAIMQRIGELVRRLADNDAPVLVTGETGTGKEVVARLLHALSPRAGKAYVPLNCGALAKNLIESELFGHERGAFTGAAARKQGAFEAGDGGTVFLDEIGELPLDLQPQLLRVVENSEVRRVGSTETFRVDIRLVAATNRRLQQAVAAGTFREDLFHRLHVLSIELPPLRDRREDIPELTQHFLTQLSPPGQRVGITDAAVQKLLAYDWPGNVRELRNVLQRAVLMRVGEVVDSDDVTLTPRSLLDQVQAQGAVSSRTLAAIERDAIVAELTRFKGNKKEAAAALGISRSTIHRKIDEYEIDVSSLTAG